MLCVSHFCPSTPTRCCQVLFSCWPAARATALLLLQFAVLDCDASRQLKWQIRGIIRDVTPRRLTMSCVRIFNSIFLLLFPADICVFGVQRFHSWLALTLSAILLRRGESGGGGGGCGYQLWSGDRNNNNNNS